MTAATDDRYANFMAFVSQLDQVESDFFLLTMKYIEKAKSKGWKTRHLRAFEKWYRERRGLEIPRARLLQ